MRHRVRQALMPSNRFPPRSPAFWCLGWLVVLGSLSVLGACPRVWAAAAAELLPTGVRITVHEMSIYRIAQGKVIEQWCCIDELDRLIQLGVVERRRQQ